MGHSDRVRTGMNVIAQSTERPEQTTPIYDANDLTQGGITANIALHGQIYTLRITRAGKLILTK